MTAQQTRIKNEWGDRALDELRDDLTKLAAHLTALADLADASIQNRSELERLAGR